MDEEEAKNIDALFLQLRSVTAKLKVEVTLLLEQLKSSLTDLERTSAELLETLNKLVDK